MADIALQSRILSLIRDGRGLVIEAAPDQPASNREWTPGQTLEARVASKLPDGRVLIDVDGTLFQVRLPEKAEASVGQRLALTVMRNGPEPTFLLQSAPDADATPAATATEVRLSNLASRVASLLGNTPATTPAVIDAEPLLPAPPATGTALVAPLKQAFETSGMFYESHQAEWVGGKRPLEALRQEPQARIAREMSVGAPVRVPTDAKGVDIEMKVPAEPVVTSSPTVRSASSLEPALPPVVAGIVDRQLDALATQQIVWQGQVWPGQTMQWQVEEREGDGTQGEQEAQWRTHLRLELPRLGEVAARLDLHGDTLRIVIDAGGGAAIAANLRAGEAELGRMLEARGLRLDGFRVNADGDA